MPFIKLRSLFSLSSTVPGNLFSKITGAGLERGSVGAALGAAAGLGLGIGMGTKNLFMARDARRQLDVRFSYAPRRGGGVVGAQMRF